MPDNLDQESYRLFSENKMLSAPEVFADLVGKVGGVEERVTALKWLVFHLIIASDYDSVKELINEDLKKFTPSQLSAKSNGDVLYCIALENYYKGFFQKTIQQFHPKKKISIIDLHEGQDYQLGHDHKLLGKAYWKMGYFTRAFFHFHLSIYYFQKDDRQSIWIAKVYGLIARVYYQRGDENKGDHFIKVARKKLQNIWETNPGKFEISYRDHHVYACILNDEAEGLLEQIKANVLRKEERNFDDNIQSYFFEATENLERAREIFKEIYNNRPNRYSATVSKNLGILHKRKAYYAPDCATAQKLFQEAKAMIQEDIAFRKELFSHKVKGKEVIHHSTLGRVYNNGARLNISRATKQSCSFTPTKKVGILLEAIHDTHIAMHYVVKKYKYPAVDKETDTWEGLEKNEITYKHIKKLAQVQSYYALLEAFSLRLEALHELVEIEKTNLAYRTAFERTQELSFKFIARVRKQFRTRIANLALSKVIKPLYEIVLNFLDDQQMSLPEEEVKDAAFQQKIMDTFESSKNYNLVQTFEKETIYTRRDEQLIKKLAADFYGDRAEEFMELQEFVPFETQALQALQGEVDNILRNCADLRKRDDNKPLKADKLKTKMSILKIRKHMQKKGVGVYEDTPSKASTLVISFFYGESNIFAFKVDAFESTLIKLPEVSPAEMETMIIELVNLMNLNSYVASTEEDSYIRRFIDYLEKPNNLYKKLIRPLGIHRPGKTKKDNSHPLLIIIPDEQLNLLPFDSIPIPNLRKKNPQPLFLIEEFYTSYHFSISHLFRSVVRRKKNSRKWLKSYTGIASNYKKKDLKSASEETNGSDATPLKSDLNIEIDTTVRYLNQLGLPLNSVRGFLEKLPFDQQEQEGLIGNTLPDNINWLEDHQALLECMQDTQILHFATHGSPDMTSIQLSENFEIDHHKINQIQNIGLVILNGCDTGKGRLSRGEGHEALGRLFLNQRGVRNVIYSVTHGMNQDQENPAEDLMFYFFFLVLRHLSSTKANKPMNYPVALARAKRIILNKKEKNEDGEMIYKFRSLPQFISGLVFVGNPLDRFRFPKKKLGIDNRE